MKCNSDQNLCDSANSLDSTDFIMIEITDGKHLQISQKYTYRSIQTDNVWLKKTLNLSAEIGTELEVNLMFILVLANGPKTGLQPNSLETGPNGKTIDGS